MAFVMQSVSILFLSVCRIGMMGGWGARGIVSGGMEKGGCCHGTLALVFLSLVSLLQAPFSGDRLRPRQMESLLMEEKRPSECLTVELLSHNFCNIQVNQLTVPRDLCWKDIIKVLAELLEY